MNAFVSTATSHLKRNCPELPYCSKCRRRGHTPNNCPNHLPRDRSMSEATEETQDHWKRTQDLPQFSNKHNKCLHCAGDHPTWSCTAAQPQQAPITNNITNGTGISVHYSTQNMQPCTSPPSNIQSPTNSQYSQSTIQVQMPTLMVNGPQFQPNLQQPHYQLVYKLTNPQIITHNKDQLTHC